MYNVFLILINGIFFECLLQFIIIAMNFIFINIPYFSIDNARIIYTKKV